MIVLSHDSLSVSFLLMDYLLRKGKTVRKMRSLFNGSLISRSKKGRMEAGGQKDRTLEAIEVKYLQNYIYVFLLFSLRVLEDLVCFMLQLSYFWSFLLGV